MLEVNHIDVFHDDLQALWDVSMTIAAGEIVSLVGSNGAGKSTLMQAICGVSKPRAGSILLDGARIDRLAAPQDRGERYLHGTGREEALSPHEHP